MNGHEIFSHFVNNLSSENRILLFNEFLSNDLVGVNITDAKGQTIFLNDAHTRITGHDKDLYFRNTMYEMEEKGIVSYSASARVIESGKSITIRQSTSNGKSFEVRGIPVFDRDGKLEMVLCLLTDITEIMESRKKMMEMEKYANSLKEAITGEGQLIYQSPLMQQIVEKAKRIAETDVSVLITGPSGVGKEMLADIIHENSSRKDKPFVKINCAAIPEQLLESELFGYEPGAFTGGSAKGKKGLIESANGGTLLLDEIGELPLILQSKLLRVLQERKVLHLGGNRPVSVDFRLISSTNEDLKQKLNNKEFREDLYYRLNVIELSIPPLEERKEDIPLLITHFIRLFNAKYDLKKSIEADALKYLCLYNYPGNVRELRNIVERMIIQSSGNLITVRDAYESMGVFGSEMSEMPASTMLLTDTGGLSLRQIMDNHEKAILQEFVKIYKNGTEIARVLKTDQSTISRKLNKYGIKY